MKILAKTKAKLLETKAESMAEVIVAFLVLSLVMALFENNDNSMIELQKTLAGKGGNASRPDDPLNRPLASNNDALKLSQYFVVTGHDTNVYWVFDANNSSDSGDQG